jgi:hypothetical protein
MYRKPATGDFKTYRYRNSKTEKGLFTKSCNVWDISVSNKIGKTVCNVRKYSTSYYAIYKFSTKCSSVPSSEDDDDVAFLSAVEEAAVYVSKSTLQTVKVT